MIMALIFSLIGWIHFNSLLKQCLIEGTTEIEVFEYKGRLYNRQRFVQLKAVDILSLSWRDLHKQLMEYETGLVSSKYPDLDKALIDAYRLALAQKKPPQYF